uniref:Uncharacterized protein n=1 Tax=Trichobilharzia regenti TaxID=157069 RepID=A0AA85J6J4_TRIRE|nr:unnamed protein product [Trichobilharzia regenti]
MDSPYLDEHYFETNEDEVCGNIPTGVDVSRENSLTGDSLTRMKAQWAEELKQVEDEIQTLRQVLLSKFRRQQYLKRQLGITPIAELKSEVKQGLDTLRTSDAYQKTSAVVKTAKDKTSAVIYEKWNLLRQSNAYKSFENKVGSAYSNVYLTIPFSNMGIQSGSSLFGKLTRSTTSAGNNEQPKNLQNLTANSSSSNGNVTDVVHQTPVSSSSQLLASSSLKKDTVNSDSTNIGDHQNDGSHGDGDGGDDVDEKYAIHLDNNLFDEEIEMLTADKDIDNRTRKNKKKH